VKSVRRRGIPKEEPASDCLYWFTHLEGFLTHAASQIEYCLVIGIGSKELIPTEAYHDNLTIMDVTEVANWVAFDRDTVDQLARLACTNWLAIDIAGPDLLQFDLILESETGFDGLNNVLVCG
jgi:hypothetical protein